VAQVGEQVGGPDVDGGVVGGRGGAVGERLADAASVDLAGLGEVREGGLEREGVSVQPVEQRRLAKDADVGVLRGVEVCVFFAVSQTETATIDALGGDI
jgi:hypothetical protein